MGSSFTELGQYGFWSRNASLTQASLLETLNSTPVLNATTELKSHFDLVSTAVLVSGFASLAALAAALLWWVSDPGGRVALVLTAIPAVVVAVAALYLRLRDWRDAKLVWKR